MSGGRTQRGSPNPEYCFSNFSTLADSLKVVLKDDNNAISLIINAKAGVIPKTHPKQLKNELTTLVGVSQDIETVKITRTGNISVVTRSPTAAQKILDIKLLLGIEVESFIQTETISSRFLLHKIDPAVTCMELAEELSSQNLVILEVRRFTRKDQGVEVPTSTVLVTILGTTLPADVKLWYELHRIFLFVDRPRQCANCHRFNHAAKACRSPKACISCASAHTEEGCSSPLKCVNCKGPHAANTKSCPEYQRELRLQEFRSAHHLTIAEARRRFEDVEPRSNKSYATVASSTISDVATKSDLEAALQQITVQFTSMVQALVAEMHQTMHTMFEAISKPLMEVVQAIQTKQAPKANMSELADLIAQKVKKPRMADSSRNVSSTPMETTPASSSFSANGT